jgi:hypothetical protein
MRSSFFASVAFLIVACASSKPAEKPSMEVQSIGVPGAAAGTKSQKVTATVEAVDHQSRRLTLKDSDGKTETITVPPEVKRLDEISAGDNVEVEVKEGLLLEYQPPGSAAVEPTAAVSAGRTDSMQAPGAAAAAAVQSTVTIIAIDLDHCLVQFQGPDGNKYLVKAGPKISIEKLKVGDRLLATYIQTVAISIDKKPRV